MGGRGSGGRNKKSAARKKVEGNAGKRKAKRASRSTQHTGPLGPPPEHLNKGQAAVWNELSAIVPMDAVQASDRWAFELLVCLMSKFRRGDAAASEVNQISSNLARFGMTPADRGRVNPTQPPSTKHDPFKDFAPALQQ